MCPILLKKRSPFHLVVLIGGSVWLKLVKFEFGKPRVRLEGESARFGSELALIAGGDKRGLETDQSGDRLSRQDGRTLGRVISPGHP